MKRRSSLRVRVTFMATLVVAVALGAAGIALESALRSSQLNAVDASLDTRASDIEALLEGNALPSVLDVPRTDIAQVIARDGTIVAASQNLAGGPLSIDLSQRDSFTSRVPQLGSDQYRLHIEADRGTGAIIVVGTALDRVDAVGDDTRNAFLLAFSLLTIFLGVVIWAVIGRALRPVEAMRAEAAEIDGHELHRRIPSPGTDDEIGHLASTMNGMLDRIEAASDAQAQFVSDASHELRTPIAIIRHQLEVAQREENPELLRAVVTDVAEENLRMQRLVDGLLLLARQDRPSDHAHDPDPLVDLDDIVLDHVRRNPAHAHIDTSQVSAGQIRGNPDHLLQVVRNLFDNAHRHATSTIAVSVQEEGSVVRFCVEDDGEGIAPADRQRIFERFSRTDESRSRHHGGAGLGLAIVGDLISRYNGTISVDGSPNLGGARFTVTLPSARS